MCMCLRSHDSDRIRLSNCTFTGGHNPFFYGGSVHAVGVSEYVEVLDCSFSDSTAAIGGAVAAMSSDVRFARATFRNCNAYQTAGALFATNRASVTDCLFEACVRHAEAEGRMGTMRSHTPADVLTDRHLVLARCVCDC